MTSEGNSTGILPHTHPQGQRMLEIWGVPPEYHEQTFFPYQTETNTVSHNDLLDHNLGQSVIWSAVQIS